MTKELNSTKHINMLMYKGNIGDLVHDMKTKSMPDQSIIITDDAMMHSLDGKLIFVRWLN